MDGNVDAIVMIVVDTLRPDRLSAYGCTAHATPNIDKLAERGVVFERVQSAASWTRPAMASLITSRHPTDLGLVEAAHDGGEPLPWRHKRPQSGHSLPDAIPTLSEQLRLAGFETAAFVNQPALNVPGNGFGRGFDHWYYPQALGEVVLRDPRRPARAQSRELSHAHVDDAALVEQFDRWASGRAPGPAFIWIHLITPHRPYSSRPDGEGAPVGSKPGARVAYDAEVRVVDAIVGRVVDIVDARFGRERSAIVLTSDHGEEFGEHSRFEHGHSLHREVVEVPLIVVAPGYSPGERIPGIVRSVDVMPTLLALAGRPDLLPAGVAGADLTPLLRGRGEDRDAYSEGVLYGSTERSLVSDGFKLMYDQQGDLWRLYDIAADPGETRDVAARLPARRDALRERLVKLHAEASASHAERQSTQRVDPGAEPSIERETEEALRALGYLGDAREGEDPTDPAPP